MSSGTLVFKPQEAFSEHFVTNANEIIANRSIFPKDVIYHIDHGGRGSGKTWTWADAVVVESALRPVRVLVTRELQNSIDESIKEEIEGAIVSRGWQHFFDMQDKVTIGNNGSRFIYKGLKNNINNIKSISDVDIVLAEEAEGISRNSWEKLLPSIRPKSGKAPIIIIIFNPDNELDETYQRFIVNTPPKSIVKRINYWDNKYFPDHLNDQRIHAKRTLPPKDYRHIWEGEPKGSSDLVIIQLDWIKAARFASRKDDWEKVGIKKAAYDPAGQGRDFHAVTTKDGNVITSATEWVRSDDLRKGTRKALNIAQSEGCEEFIYDECGGFGDGCSVFISDATFDNGKGESLDLNEDGTRLKTINVGVINPFNAGSPVVDPDDNVEGTAKKNAETYSNAKAQAHGITAQLLYNTFRYVRFGDEVPFDQMLSIDIDDNDTFNKLARELSSPIWVKSDSNSKKKVESKKDMAKRTGQPSPNIADTIHMLSAPTENNRGIFDELMAVQEKSGGEIEFNEGFGGDEFGEGFGSTW